MTLAKEGISMAFWPFRKRIAKPAEPNPTKRKSKFIMERDGYRIDYIEITLDEPIKPATPGSKILPPEKFK